MNAGRYGVAIVGATGLVGETLIKILEERRFPIGSLRLFATARSAGARVKALGADVTVERIDDADAPFADCDVVFFAAGESASRRHAKDAAQRALVIDKSSVFRLDSDVPLVVPEVNGSAVPRTGLVACPNCSTIPLAVVLAPIARAFGLAWVSVSTYQSVSGAGKEALDEWRAQNAGSDVARALPRRIAGNVIPENGEFADDGYGGEERKIAAELRKILDLPDLPVSATSVRVPVAVGHGEALAFGTTKRATRDQLRDVLARAPGVAFQDGPAYVTPLEAAGSDAVHVGRLREDHAHSGAYLCWVTCDNLRKGAATNAVQIAEAALAPQRAAVASGAAQ